MPWFTYIVTPIATGLRHPEAENAITPEMCIPIYPNEVHPIGRAPLHTIPEFPFSNCYHWIQLGLNVRVRAKPDHEVFDATRAIHLPVPQRLDMLDCWEADHDRANAILKSRRKKAVSGTAALSITRLTICAAGVVSPGARGWRHRRFFHVGCTRIRCIFVLLHEQRGVRRS